MTVTPFRPNELLHPFRQDLAKPRSPDRDYLSVLDRPKFRLAKDVASSLRIKHLSSGYFTGNVALPQSADDARYAFNTNAATGTPSPPLQAVAFVDCA